MIFTAVSPHARKVHGAVRQMWNREFVQGRIGIPRTQLTSEAINLASAALRGKRRHQPQRYH